MIQEETQEVPKWMKELEEKRERRLKARLGHEAGAGSPCLTCEAKCPGLDLHFWRKICKNCKCGKENHDVNDDDVYGWAQFQLLGSKPTKAKKIVLPGRKDAVELEWTPKGQNEAVESFLKDLPVNLLPIKGSAAAQERKQLLQKQVPLHDIDPALCHALSENEVKQMNEYIAHVKQNSVGLGQIMKLDDLLKARMVSTRTPVQVSQAENLKQQGLERAMVDLDRVPSNTNNMRTVFYDTYKNNGNFDERKALPNQVPKDSINVKVDRQDPRARQVNFNQESQVKRLQNIKNLPHYAHGSLRSVEDVQNPVDSRNILAVEMQAKQFNLDRGVGLKKLPCYTQSSFKNSEDVQNPLDYKNVLVDNLQAMQYGFDQDDIKNLPRYLQSTVRNSEDIQNPSYPKNSLVDKLYAKQYGFDQDGTKNLPRYDPSTLRNYEDTQNPLDARNVLVVDNLHAKQYGCDQEGIPHYMQSNILNSEDTQNPLNRRDFREVYPDMNVNYHDELSEHLDNVLNLKGDSKLPHFAPGKFNTFVQQQNPQTMGNIKDLAHSTYEPSFGKLNNQNTFQPHSIREENLNPTPVNVGLINDIEYPTIKAAVQSENDYFEPTVPRKNVQFNLNPEEILPPCHKCKKMFDNTAYVIGIERSDALWHADCFKCGGCNQNLADLMYFYHQEDDEIYCGRDYAKIRGIPRCQACDELIFVKEYCLAENSTFHVKHFCCFECDETLAGQNYVMEELQPLCLPCFEKVKAEKCNACLKVIKPDEQGANLNGTHFHADDDCFACRMCKKPLLGAKLLFKNTKLYCSAVCFSADK